MLGVEVDGQEARAVSAMEVATEVAVVTPVDLLVEG